MKDDYHETEIIFLKASTRCSRKSLHAFLRKRGFAAIDDFYQLLRREPPEPWQSSSVVSIQVLLAGTEVYETEEDVDDGISGVWDELRLEYLMATLPREYIDILIAEIDAISREFQLQIVYFEEKRTSSGLSSRLNQIADRLSSDWDAPGSEILRILIEQKY